MSCTAVDVLSQRSVAVQVTWRVNWLPPKLNKVSRVDVSKSPEQLSSAMAESSTKGSLHSKITASGT